MTIDKLTIDQYHFYLAELMKELREQKKAAGNTSSPLTKQSRGR